MLKFCLWVFLLMVMGMGLLIYSLGTLAAESGLRGLL